MENTDIVTQGISGPSVSVGGVEGISDGASQATTSVLPEPERPPAVAELKAGVGAPQGSATSPVFLTSLKGSGTGGTSITTGAGVPHPKKYSAVNINKKFLEKNYSASGSSHTSASATPKLVGVAAKPAPQPTIPHSRLVTTKLTALPQLSTTTGPGWSRPSSTAPSATPSVAPSPAPAGSSSNPNPPAPASHLPPQLPHAGKVIQPQPRGISPSSAAKESTNGSNKLVWGNLRGGSRATATSDAKVQNDFPTAAEAAQGRVTKYVEKNAPPEAAAVQNQEDADTFRGVHLDPNAHHWDEEEEDNDDFLGGVIEFGDGRQYKIQPADTSPATSPSRDLPPSAESSGEKLGEPTDHTHPPVKKEDRFADDFDRSWPRSRTLPSPGRSRGAPSHVPPSSTSSQSPQEPSRVLFNERSNRLEPYSYSHSRHANTGLGESRNSRDVPPHHNMRLLEKSGFERSRQSFSGAGSDQHKVFKEFRLDTSSTFVSEDWHRDRGRRISTMGDAYAHEPKRDLSREGGRQLPPHLSDMGPPTLPLHRPSTRESWHQYSSREDASSVASHALRSPSLTRNSVLSEVSPTSSTVPLADMEEVRKAAMHSAAERARLRRQQEEEEREKEKERARKKAAELEEKMNADKEKTLRDAKKPVEPAPPAQVASPLQSETANAIPDSGTSASENPALSRPPSLKPVSRDLDGAHRPWMTRSTSFRGSQAAPDGTSVSEPEFWRRTAAPLPPRALRHLPRSEPTQPPPSLAPPPEFPEAELFSLGSEEGLEEVDFSELGKLVGIEEEPSVLIPSSTPFEAPRRPPRPVASDFFDDRPPAREPPVLSKSDTVSTWRRKSSFSTVDGNTPAATSATQAESSDEMEKDGTPGGEVAHSPGSSVDIESAPSSPPKPHASSDHGPANNSFSQTLVVPPHLSSQRSPRSAAYREASMSTLDDTMSRIKGALNGMLIHDAHREALSNGSLETSADLKSAERSKPAILPPPTQNADPAKLTKWIPPALRAKRAAPECAVPREVFDVTATEPPESPKPAWNVCHMQLPKISQPVEPLSRKQIHHWKLSPVQVRWDILSFDPPVEGMTRKDFSLNDVLFRKLSASKGKPKYRVSLPKADLSRIVVGNAEALSPKVNLPVKPPITKSSVGVFSKPREADDLATWRQRQSSSGQAGQAQDSLEVEQLETVSRSPPPDTETVNVQDSLLKPEASASVSGSIDGLSRPRTQPKMPVGASVAFYRDSQVDAGQIKSPVQFIVTSELEDEHPSQVVLPPPSADAKPIEPKASIGNAVTSSTVSSPHGNELKCPPSRDQAESKSSDESSDQAPITPPSQTSTSWTKSPSAFAVKDSPARPPDPEHLKLLWSQTSTKAEAPAINSLEGIADDLQSVPFTLQEVKSEDGETPPPTASRPPTSGGPSRMSLHDVTRAFQQVPSSPAGSMHKAPHPPAPHSSLSNSTTVRQASYPHPTSAPNANMRPAYLAYPSPMMSHSPAPGVMYSHAMSPSPAPPMVVNGPSPQYAQPMWMSVAQTPGTMMRPLPTSYPAQYMPYPSQGPAPTMYAASPIMQNAQVQARPSGPQNRGRTPSVMSPVMSHAGVPHPHSHQHTAMPMYPGSPVMMHAPPPVIQVQQGYPAPGRGEVHSPYPIPGMPMMQQNHVPPPSHQTGYAPGPPNYVRPPW
ncbi:hypothetical protein EW146_g1504 [Bondarzewia mesenterica]|uniref:Uncharacterized protein n=1 Tax=Bondarzewia mesenterica TaxID=1095465 RepID=A0A4S4M3Q9_9AGAM|nr:hypothetical protein EW146_g1504 [Bondarzewia mesenterica]